MTEKAGFSLKNRNPDVLTSIANLSNDEVFTPPSFANQMLDTIEEAWAKNNKGASIWEDRNVTFLDPFTKSGVFLREITRRLSSGLEGQIPDVQERVNHILTKQVFGVAITELTALLARRSLYCSKYANGKHSICTEFDTPEGNIWFKRTEHTWVGGKEKVITVDDDGNEIEVTLDGTCKFCGAKQKEYERGLEAESHAYALIHTDDPKAWVKSTFGEDMQFDVIVGNPPYQLNDGGGRGNSAGPIYDKFVAQAKALEPRFLSMVIPSRWFSGGKGLDLFREEMMLDKRLTVIEDFFDAAEAFPGIDLSGGVCFFLWERDGAGDCEVRSHVNGKTTTMLRPLVDSAVGSFVRFNEAVEIVRKTRKNGFQSFSEKMSPRNPFGILGSDGVQKLKGPNLVPIFAYPTDGFIAPGKITQNQNWIDSYKVFITKAYGERGSFPYLVTGKPFIGTPGQVCTETYLVARICDSESEARNLISYMTTRYFRFMVLLRKNTQNAPRGVYGLAPNLDFSKPWTDEELYARYELTKSEIDFIESMIRPMELNDA